MLREGDYYIENGKYVLTKQFLLRRGYCCHSGCRHCPYGEDMKRSATEIAIDEFLAITPCPKCGFVSVKLQGGVEYSDPLRYGCRCMNCGAYNHVGRRSCDWVRPCEENPIVFQD